jgi:hypothetical protein
VRRGNWSSKFDDGPGRDLTAQERSDLAEIDGALFAIWNLGDNVLLAWTHHDDKILALAVRHYAIRDSADTVPEGGGTTFMNGVLAGAKQLEPAQFERVCHAFDRQPDIVATRMHVVSERVANLISDMVRSYGVSLVQNHAVLLLDAVGFSLQSPLDQMAMLNSLAFSVNTAYWQLLSRNIKIDFARTTTGDGFYIWNREVTPTANAELYKLMMMLLADNAAAHRKARGSWVPRLRAAFHVGEHYEFHQVEGLNPTNFSYIVGQVTVDLARLLEQALPGQILIGEFVTRLRTEAGTEVPYDTLRFVENTAASLDQLNGLDISGGRIEKIRCYLTGPPLGEGRHGVHRYRLRDKHGTTRAAYNAKINIHRFDAIPIYLGVQNEDLGEFATSDAAFVEKQRTGAYPRLTV